MKKFLNAIIVLIAFHSNGIISQDVEEIVVTSALVDTTEITNPLYVIDGEDILFWENTHQKRFMVLFKIQIKTDLQR